MNGDQITKCSTPIISSYSCFHSYISSAVDSDTEKYIVVPADKMCEVSVEETGKYSIFDIANWFLCKGDGSHGERKRLKMG